jgi:Spy/CpxP family protein refolding chaperone
MNIIKSMKTIISVSTMCAVIAFSSIASVNASANDKTFESDMRHNKSKSMMKRMVKLLLLSEEQQVKIKAIKMQTKEQSGTLRDSMKQFKGAERLLLQAEKFDEKAYTALHTAYQQTFAEMALTRTKTKHAIFNVLTTEQQDKWLNKMEKRKRGSNRN